MKNGSLAIAAEVGEAPARRRKTAEHRFSSAELVDRLRDRIRQGEWKAGERIPSGTDLIREFDVCQNTLGRALRQLQREGHIVSFQGKGRFVRPREDRRATRTVGVFLASDTLLDHPVVRERLRGIESVLLNRQYYMKLAVLPDVAEVEEDRWDFDLRSVDAVIDFGADPVLARAMARWFSTPYCKFSHTVSEDHFLNVRHDYLGGTFRAVKHLLDLGHRRLAFITLRERVGLTRLQCEGAALAVEAVRPAEATCAVYETDDYSDAAGRDAVRRMLAAGPAPTGLVCGADDFVPGVWNALTEAGLRVPEDVSLVGFNDVLPADATPAPVTSIRMDYRRSGEMAAELVLDYLARPEGEAWESPAVPAELVVRATTVPPRERP